ncbi:MAG: hypothetical protein RR630_10660, partial [Coprobacillus sp.]
MFPRININLDKVMDNVNYLYDELSYLDEVYVVTKVHSAFPPLIKKLYEGNVRHFADSRIKNLKSIKEMYPDAKTMQLR